MDGKSYITGSDVLGANLTEQYVIIRLKDVAGTVKKQSKVGELVQKFAPQTIANMVYDKMKQQIAKGFADQGVDAEVTVASVAPAGQRSVPDIVVGAVGGLLAVGIGYAGWRFGIRRLVK